MSAKTKKAPAKRAPAKRPAKARSVSAGPKKKQVKKAPKPKAAKPKVEEVPIVEEAKPSQVAPVVKETKPAAVVQPSLGEPPSAEVSSRHLDLMRTRAARGFSIGELDSAGVPPSAAKRQEVSVDVRRRSVVSANVEKLRSWFKPGASETAKEKPKPKAKRA